MSAQTANNPLRGGEGVSRMPHKHQTVSANLTPATICKKNGTCLIFQNMYNPIQLGVRAAAMKAVNEIPTPFGVARQSTRLGCSLTGVSLTAFLFALPLPSRRKSLSGMTSYKRQELSICKASWRQRKGSTGRAGSQQFWLALYSGQKHLQPDAEG